jgi:hypothetical protein
MPANTGVFHNQENIFRELSGFCQHVNQAKTAIFEMNPELISRCCFEFDFEVAHFFQQPDE